MFGYVKPDKENLLVKDLALYKATYCGLCSVIKKEISFFLPFALSYDFVFLAMVRSAIKGEKSKVTKGFCKYNPLKKCAFSVGNCETLYTARCSLILTALKLEDDIKDRDTPFYKRAIARPFYNHLKKRMNNLEGYDELILSIREGLEKLSRLEKENSPELDKACEIFGDIMAMATAFGLDDKEAQIAREVGSATGRYVYLVDAVDDLEKDAKSGAYNPLIARYGTVEKARASFNEIDVAFAMYANRAQLAVSLLDECEYSRIINNIIVLGFGAEAYKIMTRNGDKDD